MRDQFLKIAARAIAVPFALHRMRKKKIRYKLVTVLCLHRVSDEISLIWPPLPVAVFEHLCRYWSKHYCVTTFNDLNQHAYEKKPLLVLSFDDGYADFYTNAWPILQKYGLKANMNIVTSCITDGTPIWTQRMNNAFDEFWKKGIVKTIDLPNRSKIAAGISKNKLKRESRKIFQYFCTLEKEQRFQEIEKIIRQFNINEVNTPYMNWEQIIKLSKEGLEIGGHTLTHDILSTIKDPAQLYEEVVASKMLIEEKIGKKVNVFAFPNGISKAEVISLAFDAGYQYLVSVDNDLFPSAIVNQKKVLPRILIHYTGCAENVLTTENFFTKIKAILK